MAEPCSKAFGRYLKTLRERRGLSLDDVRSLSQTFPDKIFKAYLSRCENGHQRLAFSKLIPLSRIYEVPSDVLVERMELDMELERLEGPDTEGMSYEELRLAGVSAYANGQFWDAYGFARDALRYADRDPILSAYRDNNEQLMVANLNCATIARGLGRYKFCLHETQAVTESSALGENFRPLLLERTAVCHQMMGNPSLASELGDEAIEAARLLDEAYPLAYTYSTRAELALDEEDTQRAITCYQHAYRHYKESGRIHDCARTLNNVAQIYFDLGRFRSARSALLAAQSLLPGEKYRAVALSKILLGEIDELENRSDLATKHWTEALAIANSLKDRTLRFKTEFQLYKHAKRIGNAPTMRAIQRRLRRLSAWVPIDTPELREFKVSGN